SEPWFFADRPCRLDERRTCQARRSRSVQRRDRRRSRCRSGCVGSGWGDDGRSLAAAAAAQAVAVRRKTPAGRRSRYARPRCSCLGGWTAWAAEGGAPHMSVPFTDLIDLASERLGGAAILANDEFFAAKDNLVKPAAAIWLEGKYTDRGKWMDGWETRRRRTPGHDFCIVRLGAPGIVHGVIVDTAFFKGNYPEACSIDACSLHANVDPDFLRSPAVKWFEL